MARLPTPGSDQGIWGGLLNEFLRTSHNPDGTLKSSALGVLDGSIDTAQLANDAVTNAKLDVPTQTTLATVSSKYTKPAGGVPSTDLSSAVLASLDKADSALQSAPVSSVNGKTGVIVLDQDDVTDGTTHKQYSVIDKTKLAGITVGATANDSDANLKARTNHTGTQTAATISDFDAEVNSNTGVAAATAHIANTSNPHAVTKNQVGLASVDNTSDAAKPISTAQATADALNLKITSNLSDLNNVVTARTNLGLGTLATQSGTLSGTSSGTNTGDQTLNSLLPAQTDNGSKVLGTNGTTASWVADTAGSGTVTGTSVVSANGLAGTVTTPTTTPAITLSTTVTGIVKGDGTGLTAAIAGDFPTLNQNTTGTAASAGTVTTNANLTGPITSAGNATSVASQTGTGSTFVMNMSPAITTPTGIVKGDVGLGNVDNVSDTNKPVSTATQTALDLKADSTATDASFAALPTTYMAIGTQTAMVNRMTRTCTYLIREEKLSIWRTALTNRATATAQVLVIGDSISEGTGTTNLANRWQNILQTSLRYRHSGQVGADWPFIPGKYQTSSLTGAPVVVAGTVVANSGTGMNGRTAALQDETAMLTYTFTGTSCRLLYLKASSTGTVRIVVDGGSPVIFDTNSVTAGPGDNAAAWASGALTAGVHSVVVTRDASSPAGKSPFIHGLLTYNGDETVGIRVVDAARHGISSATLTVNPLTSLNACIAKAGTFGLLLYVVGTNDYTTALAPATYKTNIDAQIASLRAAGFAGSIALVNMYKGGGRDEATWAAYGQQLNLIATGDSNIAYFDLRLRMPDGTLTTTDPLSLGLFSDTVHPSDSGNSWIADVMTDYLSLRA